MKTVAGIACLVVLTILAPAQAGAFGIAGVGEAKADLKGSGLQVQSGKIDTVRPQPPATGMSKPVLLAQSAAENSAKMNQMQEQVRRLNGQVEDLTFQLLQLQEQIRKMQEDNEFRFQELEEKQSNSGAATGKNPKFASKNTNGEKRLGKSSPSEGSDKSTPSGGQKTGKTKSKTIVEAGRVLGLPPRNLGTLKFDANGNVIESAVGKPLDLTIIDRQGSDQSDSGIDTANLEPGLIIARGRDYFEAGDYVLAERVLNQFIKANPESALRPEAQYWIGRSLFSRSDFHAAATIFLDTHNTYPDAKRAPDTLLRLGLSMAGLNHREIACATYAEVGKQFPDASEKVKTQVAIEQKSAGC